MNSNQEKRMNDWFWYAIGAATGAPVLLLVIHDQRADGPLTDRAVNLTALNNVFSVVAVTMLLALLHLEYRPGVTELLLHPLYLLVGSALLGYLAAVALVLLAGWLGKREELQFIALVAMVLLTVGVAKALQLSMLMCISQLAVASGFFVEMSHARRGRSCRADP
jgi:uncharacterized membrane protein YbhN (UPF0104 family)